jgi:hypothetical protein
VVSSGEASNAIWNTEKVPNMSEQRNLEWWYMDVGEKVPVALA